MLTAPYCAAGEMPVVIAGGFGGGCGIEGIHPVGAQLLVFFQQILVLLVGGNVAGFDRLHQIGGGAGFGGSI